MQNWLAQQVQQKKSTSQSADEKNEDREEDSVSNRNGSSSQANLIPHDDVNQASATGIETEQPTKPIDSQPDTLNVFPDKATEDSATTVSSETTANLLPVQSVA